MRLMRHRHVPQTTCCRHRHSPGSSGDRTEAWSSLMDSAPAGPTPILALRASARRRLAIYTANLQSRVRLKPRAGNGPHLAGIAIERSGRVKSAKRLRQATRISRTYRVTTMGELARFSGARDQQPITAAASTPKLSCGAFGAMNPEFQGPREPHQTRDRCNSRRRTSLTGSASRFKKGALQHGIGRRK